MAKVGNAETSSWRPQPHRLRVKIDLLPVVYGGIEGPVSGMTGGYGSSYERPLRLE